MLLVMSVGFILLVQLSALYCLYKCRRYIACISVGLILPCRANDPQNIFHNHQHIFYQWLKLLIGVTVILTSRGVLCILKNCKDQSTYNQSLSPRAIILFTQLVPTLFCKIQKNKLFHKYGHRRYQYIVTGRDKSYFVKQNTIILIKCFLQFLIKFSVYSAFLK